MGLTPAKLRTWILILAGCLVAAIAGFFLYGRWQGRRLGHDRPGGLETSIQQSTEGFTYSESRGGHTIYTLHASKAVQYKGGGHAELHDVSITLYGAEGQPANRIYGSDFDWDPVRGIARAVGEVQIDFQGAAPPGPQAGKTASDESENKNTVHVKTSGLVFNKQTGLASTTEKIEFRLAEAAGSATGASFDSQTGIIILAADVAFNSSVGGNPLEVRSHHAQYDRASRLLYLLQDVTDYADSHSSSDQATVSFRTDGSAYQVLAEGHVVFTGNDGQQVNARIAHVDLDAKSAPQQAMLDGGLLYVANDESRLIHGSAASGTMLFGPQTTIRHAQLRTAVSVVDEEKLPQLDTAKTKQNAPQSTTRQLQASQVDIDFAPPGPDRRPLAQHILAAGGGRVNVHTIYAKTPPEDMTIGGDQLFATLENGEVLSSVRGTGHTSLVTVSPAGVTQSSKGDNLLLTFASPRSPQKAQGKAAKGKQTNSAQPAAQLQSAVQLGNVTLIQQAAATAGGQTPAPTTATAQRAAYDAATQIVQLTGNPRILEETGELSATLLEMDRATGNATAKGDVKATYRDAKGQEVKGQEGKGQQNLGFAGTGPVHVVADHAHLDHATDITTFYGKAGGEARLWQGNDSVSAPVLELSRAHGTLSAHGSGSAAAVYGVFTSSQTHAKPDTKTQTAPSVVRVQSRTLFYAENDHKAVFSGGVVAQTISGILHSSFMDIYFSPTPSPKSPDQPDSQKPPSASSQNVPSQSLPSQSVSKIVARGAVQLEQPGRKGTGEELTYTAADGKFVLTGTSGAPPRLSDQVRGVVTGNALIFNDRDDSVVVSGGASNAVTQTRVAR
jgi:lipopolysaccharide export system protein LptA